MPLLPIDGGWEAYRYGGNKQTGAQSFATSGDNAVVTPAANQILTLLWVALSTPATNAVPVLATVRLGAAVAYMWNLGLPGAFSHWEPIQGVIGAGLILNLSAGGNPVLINYTYLVA